MTRVKMRNKRMTSQAIFSSLTNRRWRMFCKWLLFKCCRCTPGLPGKRRRDRLRLRLSDCFLSSFGRYFEKHSIVYDLLCQLMRCIRFGGPWRAFTYWNRMCVFCCAALYSRLDYVCVAVVECSSCPRSDAFCKPNQSEKPATRNMMRASSFKWANMWRNLTRQRE